jgi:hypothetical protein
MGQLFDLESDLVEALLPDLGSLFPDTATVVFAPEVAHHARVVDLVVCDAGDPRETIPDWASHARALRSLSTRHMSVMAIIGSEGPISLERLSRVAWTSEDDLESEYVAPLVESGLVERRSTGSLCATSWAEWDVRTIVAVEAKLSDWRNVVQQAAQNGLWADYSYVAMPSGGAIERREVRGVISESRVGAIDVHPRDGSRVLVRARRGATTLRRRRSQFAASMLADLLAGQRWTLLAEA